MRLLIISIDIVLNLNLEHRTNSFLAYLTSPPGKGTGPPATTRRATLGLPGQDRRGLRQASSQDSPLMNWEWLLAGSCCSGKISSSSSAVAIVDQDQPCSSLRGLSLPPGRQPRTCGLRSDRFRIESWLGLERLEEERRLQQGFARVPLVEAESALGFCPGPSPVAVGMLHIASSLSARAILALRAILGFWRFARLRLSLSCRQPGRGASPRATVLMGGSTVGQGDRISRLRYPGCLPWVPGGKPWCM